MALSLLRCISSICVFEIYCFEKGISRTKLLSLGFLCAFLRSKTYRVCTPQLCSVVKKQNPTCGIAWKIIILLCTEWIDPSNFSFG